MSTTLKRIVSVVVGAVLAGSLLVGAPASPAQAMTLAQSAKGDIAKTAKKVVLESKPKASSKNVASLPKGTRTTATGKESKGWIQVTAKVNGKTKTGWLRGADLIDVWDTKGKVTVTGDPAVGAYLTANTTFTEAGQRVRVEYRWYRDGKPTDEYQDVYWLTSADKGKRISVKATARASGLPAKSVTSVETAKVTPPAQPVEFDIDNTSKASVSKAFTQWKERAQYQLDADKKWVVAADLAKCVTGRLSDAQRRYSTSLLNFYRELAGVPKVVYDPSLEIGTMNAAVLNSVNDQFSHYFSKKDNPKCWSQLGGNTTHNILYGGSGLSWNIPGWISDDQNVQDNVGHRTNLMHSYLQNVAFGLTAGGGIASGYATGEGARLEWTWPPAGWFPAEELPTRWSFADVIPGEYGSERFSDDRGRLKMETQRTGLTVEVAHDGKTTKPKAYTDWFGDWFRMPADLRTGDYQVTLTGAYTATTTHRSSGVVIEVEDFIRTYTYTVRVY